VVVQSSNQELEAGMLVDRVLGIRSLSADRVDLQADFGSEPIGPFAAGAVVDDDSPSTSNRASLSPIAPPRSSALTDQGMAVLVDVDKLLYSDEMQQFAAG